METKTLESIINTILDKFNSDINTLVESETNFSSNYFAYNREGKRSWDGIQRCMYKGCKSSTITGSHTLQEAGPLKNIAENNYVYQPNPYKGEVNMEKKPIRVASTFPGFCEKHEDIFSPFEKKKEISEESHVRLQVFRTICRQIYLLKHSQKNSTEMQGKYNDIKRQYFKDRLAEAGIVDDIKNHVQTLMNRSIDLRLDFADSIKKLAESALTEAKSLYESIIKDIEENQSSRIYNYVFKLDISFPVALSGFGNFYAYKGSSTDYVPLVLNVIPSKHDTILIISGPIRYKKSIKSYMDHSTQNELFAICMIEQWMLHGTDHWFIKPSVWDNMEKTKRELILGEILDLNKDINSISPVSIFDDLKYSIIHFIEKGMKVDEIPYPIRLVIEREKAKMNNLDTSNKKSFEDMFGNLLNNSL
ncbi:hypothetical protein [Bacillus cereus]|uniref:Uncharacterized protein n=1 Tax=Bacillus cereus TaxID=1396 RepID=A0A2C1LJ47_BACCE|nr:hypothetical protein [Bacillus cereus]PGT97710.1 hypothetical protein COD19_24445 [Bacillus cereus]